MKAWGLRLYRWVVYNPFMAISVTIQIAALWFLATASNEVLYFWMTLVEWAKFQVASALFALVGVINSAIRAGLPLNVNHEQRSVFAANNKRERKV